ncbi:MAG: BlaI/MecI/CopY family transcriptional regulator [Gemmiger sp.]
MEKLSRAEEQVMAGLWACGGPATRRQIADALPKEAKTNAWADSTLLNFLLRLQKKGFVRPEKQGNKNLYIPLVRRQTYCAAVADEMVHTLFGGDLRNLAKDLADTGRLSNAQMERLARWLDNRVVEYPEYDYE